MQEQNSALPKSHRVFGGGPVLALLRRTWTVHGRMLPDLADGEQRTEGTALPDFNFQAWRIILAFIHPHGEDALQEALAVFHSPEVQSIKEEIVAVGKKLWQRQYVDGNGGNISARIAPQFVICSPTLISKGDLRVEDLTMVDLHNRKICGTRAQTSELLLHLEIYRAAPAAQAVVHCHPPYATAHAIAGIVPQPNLLPEQEVFVGPVALADYETPGTSAFARTVRPFAKNHNTILLMNHGIVCWADSVTHAEWNVEILETYCKTVMIASQLRPTLPAIAPSKVSELLTIKQKLDLSLPDARIQRHADDDC